MAATMTTPMMTPIWEASTLSLVPGASWNSFEKFRTSGSAGLTSLPRHSVSKLSAGNRRFCVIDEDDFQVLLGLASEVDRSRKGLNVVVEAIQIAVKHPDKEHMQHVLSSLSMVAQTPLLPVRQGHAPFGDKPEDKASDSAEGVEEDFDIATFVPERV
jgi:hypothetical protein